MTPDQRKKIEDAAEAYRDADFEGNPNGYTVATYVNYHTTSDAFTAGAEFGLGLAREASADAYRMMYDTVAKERDALTARVKELEHKLSFTNSNWPHEKKALERISKLRAALEFYANSCAVWDSGNPARAALEADKGE